MSFVHTIQSDAQLVSAVKGVKETGSRFWRELAKELGYQSPEQCKARWKQLEATPGLYTSVFRLGARPQSTRNPRPKSSVRSAESRTSRPRTAFAEHVEKNNDIVIHVHDEHRGVKKDFSCNQSLLVREMKYFETYLKDTASYEEVDISVHCDVNIFQWLMNWMSEEQKPALSVGNVVSILISSDFLRMANLTDECLDFFHSNINAILKSPVDLKCMSTDLVDRLAHRFDLLSLSTVKDKKDKLSTRLHRQLLQQRLRQDSCILYQCVWCEDVFTRSQLQWSNCPNGQPFVEPDGAVVYRHTRNRAWDIQKYLLSLRVNKSMTWSSIHWLIWGLCTDLYCSTCQQRFRVPDLHGCVFHSRDPLFLRGENSGFYPCCDLPARRFDPLPQRSGCHTRTHTVTGSDAEQLHRLQPHLAEYERQVAPFTASIKPRPNKQKQETFTLTSLSVDGSRGWADKEPDYGDSSDINFAMFLTDGKDDVGQEDDTDIPTTSRSFRPDSSSKHLSISDVGSAFRPRSAAQKHAKIRNFVISDRPRASSAKVKPKVWKHDSLRHDDRQRMDSLIEKLTKLRAISAKRARKGSAKMRSNTAMQ